MTTMPRPAGLLLALVVPWALALCPGSATADRNNANWPCVQRKVPKLSAGQVWDGPALDSVADQPVGPGVTALVEKLSNRRIPVDAATLLIESYAKALPPADRNAQLTLVFAGLFDRVNTERSVVMDGIERFENRQKARSAELEREGTRIARLKDTADPDGKATTELARANELFDWNVRVFQERQTSMPIACEIPVLMEQRLYELAHAIRTQMGN